MIKIYACLQGEWKDLSEDENCIIGNENQSPSMWWEEGAEMYNPKQEELNDECIAAHSYYTIPFVHIIFQGKRYRVLAQQLQIVQE